VIRINFHLENCLHISADQCIQVGTALTKSVTLYDLKLRAICGALIFLRSQLNCVELTAVWPVLSAAEMQRWVFSICRHIYTVYKVDICGDFRDSAL